MFMRGWTSRVFFRKKIICLEASQESDSMVTCSMSCWLVGAYIILYLAREIFIAKFTCSWRRIFLPLDYDFHLLVIKFDSSPHPLCILIIYYPIFTVHRLKFFTVAQISLPLNSIKVDCVRLPWVGINLRIGS